MRDVLKKYNWLTMLTAILFVLATVSVIYSPKASASILPAQSVDSLTLITAGSDSGTDLKTLSANDSINICKLPTNKLSIRANTTPNTVARVKFALDSSSNYHTEYLKPYTLNGNLLGLAIKSSELATVGTHTITATPYNILNQAGQSKTVVLTVNNDCAAPTVPTLLSPANGAYAQSSNLAKMDWNNSTDANAVTYMYQSSTSSNVSSDGAFTSSVYTSGWLSDSEIPSNGTPEGVYYWHVKAQDSLGNASAWSAVWVVHVDNTSPTASFSFSGTGAAAKTFRVMFSESVNEAEANNPINYYLNNWPGAGGSGDVAGDATVSYDNATKTTTIELTQAGWYISPEQQWGTKDIHDLAGNLVSPNPSAGYSTPMVAPATTASLSGTLGLNSFYTSNVTVSLSAADPAVGSGVKATYFNLDGAGYFEGSSILVNTDGGHNLCYYSVDNAGNTEAAKCDVSFKIDKTAPSLPVILGFINPTLSCGATTNIHNATVDWMNSTDTYGLSGYEYDVNYPLANGTGRGQWATFLTSSQYGGSLNEGYHDIKVRAKDLAGNLSDWSNVCRITTDWTAPQAPQLVSPENNAVVKGGVLTNRWSSVTDATKYVYESYNNASATSLRWRQEYTSTSKTATNVANSVFWWRVKAVDAAGNSSLWSDLWKVTIDNTAPNITPQADILVDNDPGLNGAVVAFSLSATDNVDESVAVICDIPSGSFFVVGDTTVNCNVKDTAGNTATTSFKVTVNDNEAPVIKMIGTDVSLTVGDSYADQGANALDNNDGSITPTSLSTVNTATPGVYTVTYGAKDSNANEAIPVTRTVTVNAAPAVATLAATPPTRVLSTFFTGGAPNNPTAPTTNVLGTETKPTNNDNSGTNVLGTNSKATMTKLFGVAWYWWLLAVIAMIVIFFVLKRQLAEEK